MDNWQEPLSDADTTSYTDLELFALDNLQCSQPIFSASCIYINCTTFKTANLILQNKEDYKSPGMQRVEDTALFNSTPFAEQCYDIIQYLHSPEIDRYYLDYINQTCKAEF